MPNWGYLFVSFLYHLGLAVWIGGIVVLGALVAPRLFSTLERPQAGEIFGSVLRRFARLRLVAIMTVIAAAGVKSLVWELSPASGGGTIWILIRWGLIAWLTLTVVYEIVMLEPAMRASHAGSRAGGTGEAAARERFSRLHVRSERLMKVSLLAALAALFLN
ncbi:MAG TPA: DUF4149 domain-containing protein [Thermoanaerobaculia bacterium]|nr:DUF4149 domain-containing protein [Thermoanaerobaculia bacterium]